MRGVAVIQLRPRRSVSCSAVQATLWVPWRGPRRKTCCACDGRGAPVQVVQATLGHSSLATTSRDVHARPSESSAKYLAV